MIRQGFERYVFHFGGCRPDENRDDDHVAFTGLDAVGQKKAPRDSATVCAAICRT
jgi:hypothetical protein